MNIFLLIASILLFVSVLITKAGSRYGIPTLLLFLLVGILFGVDGLGLLVNPREAASTSTTRSSPKLISRRVTPSPNSAPSTASSSSAAVPTTSSPPAPFP